MEGCGRMTKYKLYLASSVDEAKGCSGYGKANDQMVKLADAVKSYLGKQTDQIEIHRNAKNFSLEQVLWDANSAGIPNNGTGLFLGLSSNYLETVTTQVTSTGSEVYWHKALTNHGQRAAELIYQEVGTIMGKKRCVEDSQLEKKVKELEHIEFPAALVYVLYQDNPNDVIRYRATFDSIAIAIANSILRYWKLNTVVPQKPTQKLMPKTIEELIPLITSDTTLWEEKAKVWKLTNPAQYKLIEELVLGAFQLGVTYGD